MIFFKFLSTYSLSMGISLENIVSEHFGLSIKMLSREKILFDCVSLFLRLPVNACH